MALVNDFIQILKGIAMQRFILWPGGALLVLIGLVVLVMRFSPWPSVAIISYFFSKGDQASEAALKKHVPAGVVCRRDIAYGAESNEAFDLYYLEGTNVVQPTIVWVHGGGFIAGSKGGIANYMKVLAGHGYTAIAVEYSRGYGTTYPKPVEQVNAALGFLIRNALDLKVDPTTIILAGDSAGAHIASQVALITTDPAYASAIGISPQVKANQLRALLLLSGTYDPSSVNFEGNYAWFRKTLLWAYLGVKNFHENERFPLMSVTGHVTSSFPPSFISSGNGDPLAPQAIALAQKLSGLGVNVETLFFPGDRAPALPHEYQFNLDEAPGREALKRMLGFLEAIRQR